MTSTLYYSVQLESKPARHKLILQDIVRRKPCTKKLTEKNNRKRATMPGPSSVCKLQVSCSETNMFLKHVVLPLQKHNCSLVKKILKMDKMPEKNISKWFFKISMRSKRVNLKNHLNRRIKAANKLDHPPMTAAWNKLGIKIWCFNILKAKCETSQ